MCYDYAVYADTVIINGGLTTVNGAYSRSIQGYTYGIYAVSSVTVNGGTLNVNGGFIGAAIDSTTCAVSVGGSFTVNNNPVVYIKGGNIYEASLSRESYGLVSPDIVLNGGNITLEGGYLGHYSMNANAASSIPKIQMPLGIWKDSLDGEYSLASITPYAPDNASDITYLNVKHIEAVVTSQLQINSTTGEWEVSYNDGQTWQPLGVAAKGADGVDGTTPQISIGADNCWQVSYDNGNTWTSLNVKALGMDGANGTNGADGRDGVDGTNGADGRDGTDGVNGRNGTDGTNGANGKNGADGLTPHIGENGNWYIGDTDTGVAATGKNGKNGKNGVDGKDGVNGMDGKDGKNGTDGKDGVGISTAAIDADECLIVTFTDGSTVNAGKLPTNIQKMTKVRTLSTASAVAAGISLTGAVTSVLYLFKRKTK